MCTWRMTVLYICFDVSCPFIEYTSQGEENVCSGHGEFRCEISIQVVRCRYPIAGESSWQETLLHRSRRKIQVQKGAHDVVRPSETLSPLTYMGLLSKSAILEMGEAGYRIVSCSHTQHSEFVTTETLINSPFLLCGRGQSDGQRRDQNDSSRSRVTSI